MTKYTKISLLLIVFGVTLVFAGCSSDDNDNNPTDPVVDQNEFPTIQAITVTPPYAIYVGDTVVLSPVTSDPDGDEIRYTWTATGGTFDPPEAVGRSVEWTAPAVAGTYQIIVVGDDGNGGTSQKQMDVKVIGGNQSGVTVDVVGGVEVNPVAGLTDLGYVDAGDVITLVWDGLSYVNVDATQPVASNYAPDGTNVSTGNPPQFGWAPNLPAPDAARYCLVGLIDGSGSWFTFTQSGNTFTATAPDRGKLLLGVNEQEALLVDNTGYWRLTFSNVH